MATEKLAGSCRATGLLDWWSTARPMDLKTILYSELSTVLFICKEMARDGQSQDLQWYEERILERWTPNFWSTCTLGDHGWSHVNVACASLSMRIHMYMYIVIIDTNDVLSRCSNQTCSKKVCLDFLRLYMYVTKTLITDLCFTKRGGLIHMYTKQDERFR